MFRPLQPDLRKPLVALTLTGIILVGTGLRFTGLEKESLWFDEACSWYTASHPTLSEVVTHDRSWHLHPPAYFLSLHFAIALAGDSEIALRFPSAIAGVLAIPLMFIIAARVYSSREGLIAAGLFATLWCPVYFAQEARPYALLMFFLLLATAVWTYLIDRLRARGTVPYGLLTAYAALAALSCYTHYFGIVFIGLQAILTVLLLYPHRPALIAAGCAYAAAASLYLPWLPSLWSHLTDPAIGHTRPDQNIVTSFFAYLYFLFNHSYALLGLVLVLYASLIARSVRRRAGPGGEPLPSAFWKSPGFVLILWLVLPLTIAYLKSVSSPSVFTTRNLLISMPAAYLLLARAIIRIPLPRPLPSAFGAVLIATLLYRLAFVGEFYDQPIKDQFREAVDAVVAQEETYPDALIVGNTWNACAFDYYFMRSNSSRKIDVLVTAMEQGRNNPDYVKRIAETIENSDKQYVWFLYSYPTPGDPLLKYLNEHLEAIEHSTYIRTAAYLFKKKPLPPQTSEN